jgi:hypothetical protein
MLTRDEIRASDKQDRRVVPVPQWGGDVLIRGLSVIEQEGYWAILDDAKKGITAPAGQRGSVLYSCCINEDGSQFWKEEDAAWLGSEANAGAVDVVYLEIVDLSGFSTKAQSGIAKKHETPTSSSLNGSSTDGASGTSTKSSGECPPSDSSDLKPTGDTAAN